jgi:hypothetical protein
VHGKLSYTARWVVASWAQLGHGQLEIQEEFGWSHSKFLLYLDLTITCKPKARRKSLLQLQDAGI